ncbi:unnamed protein product [Amoebophrya sp. A25]|nr:unnamed protein product [Amoebophrya sp. A25]|eukprot:GSA25T00022977001.1
MFLKLLFRRGTSQLVNISFLGVLVFVNEIVIKKLMRQSRPAESCAGNFGMPSGHSTVSAGLFTLKILQLIYKTDLHMQLRKNAIRVWKGYHDEYEVVQNENEQNADNKINKNIVAQLELEGGKELDHVANTSSTTPATDKARAGTGGCAASGRRRAQMMPQAHQEAPEDEVQLDVAIVPASSDQSTTDENYDTSEEGRMQNRLSAIEEEIMDDEAERLLSFSSNFKGGAQAADAATIQEMAVGIYGPEDAAIARASVHYPRILENESENTGRREGLKLVGRNDRNKNNRSKSSGNTNNAKSNMIKVKMTKAEDDVVVGDEGAATENEDFCSVAPPPLNTGTRRSKRPASLSTTTKRAPQRSDDLYFLYSRLLRRPFSRLFGCCEAEKYDYNGNFCDAGEDEVVSHAEAALWAFVWVGLLGPVGPCRAVLRDHTPSQIMTGLISGFCVGALCFLATRALARRCSHHLGRHICCFLKHDFAVPFHQFRIQILEDTLPRLKVKISARSQTKQLQNPRHAAHQQDDDYTTTTSSSGASSARPSAQGQAMRTSSRVFQKITDQEEYETIRHFRSILLQVQWYYRQRKAALSRAEKEGLDQDISACTHKVSEVMELRRCVRQAMKECFFFSPAEDDLLKRNNNNRNPRYKVGENFAAPGDLIQLVGEQEYDDQITENNATTMLNNLEPQVPLLNGNGQHIIMPALEENVVDHDTTSRQEEEPCTSNAEAALTEPLLGSAK